MHIRIFRNIPTPSYMYNRINTAHNTPLKIELGKHWEIFVTREMTESIYDITDQIPAKIKFSPNIFINKLFLKKIMEAEIIPFWYGYAYYHFDSDVSVYMPVPLNFAAAGLRWLRYKWFGFKQIPRGLNSTQEAYGRGYKAGYEEGFNE